MNCAHVRQMLDALLDGELDAKTTTELTEHLAGCPDCVARKTERDLLRANVRAAAPRFVASPALKQSILKAVRASQPGSRRAQPTWWQTFGLAAGACVVGIALTMLVTRGVTPAGESTHAGSEQIALRHVASLARTSPVDVESTDRHVIKPWFHGRIDFAPAVKDLSAHGFTLRGARLDDIAGQQAVAVVYQIRQHPISVFVWSTASTANTAPESSIVRGFSTIRWHADGLAYAAISDVEPGELARFVREMTSRAVP
jgi:anti-sigma factor RsiW